MKYGDIETTFPDLMKANAQIKTTNIGGKAYAPVAERIMAFRSKHTDDGFIETSTEMLDENTCLARATVGYYYGEQRRILGTGTAFEDKESSRINHVSFVENAETSAVGRALGMAGYGLTTGGVASAEEMNKVSRITERQVGAILKIYQGDDAGLMDLMEAAKVSDIEKLTIDQATEILTMAKSHGWTALTREELDKVRRRRR